MFELLSYSFMHKALLAGIIIGLATGMLAPFIVLRRLSLLGDGIAHLAFGGIAIGFLLGVSPFITALVVAVLGALFVRKLIQKNVYGEAAIALILSFGIGIGVVILGATRGFGVNLFSFLIGSILALQWYDIIILSLLGGCTIIFIWRYYRELFLLTFQQDLAHMESARTRVADIGFTIIAAVVTIMTVQAVGILLVSALLVVPALIALRMSTSFKQTIVYAIGAAVLANTVGIIGSFYADVPPSGFIVLTLLGMYMLILMLKR